MKNFLLIISFDIQYWWNRIFWLIGEYRLDELERDLSSDQYGDVAYNRGVGAF